MIFSTCLFVVLCLVSVSHSAPLACEQLIRPLDQLNPQNLTGIFALVAGSLSHLPFLDRFKQRDSASIKFTRNTDDTSFSYTRSIRLENQCSYSFYNITLEGSTFTYDGTDNSNVTSKFVHTSCQDCLLMHMNVVPAKRDHFYLFSRRRGLEPKEMEEFNAQVECMNLPPAVLMDPTKDLCPDEPDSNPQDPTENK